METEINGIILNGRVYEIVATEQTVSHCHVCDLRTKCKEIWNIMEQYSCATFGDNSLKKSYFRFSPELTEKLKGE